MPKIDDVLAEGGELPVLQKKVLEHLEAHWDEVFSYGDAQALAQAIGHPKASAARWTVWFLHQKGLVDREKVRGRFYYGSKRAIASLRRRLSKP